MNKSVFRTAGLVGVAVAMVASAAGAWAQSGGSSTIPTPASSADSGSRAVVAITVPTATDVQNIAIGAAQTVNQAVGTVCGIGTTDYTEKKSGWSWGVASFNCNGTSVKYSPGASSTKWIAPCPSGYAGRTQGGSLPYSSTVIAYCEKT